MDENVTMLMMFLAFVSFLLVLILVIKSVADETNDRDLSVEQTRWVLEEKREEKK